MRRATTGRRCSPPATAQAVRFFYRSGDCPQIGFCALCDFGRMCDQVVLISERRSVDEGISQRWCGMSRRGAPVPGIDRPGHSLRRLDLPDRHTATRSGPADRPVYCQHSRRPSAPSRSARGRGNMRPNQTKIVGKNQRLSPCTNCPFARIHFSCHRDRANGGACGNAGGPAGCGCPNCIRSICRKGGSWYHAKQPRVRDLLAPAGPNYWSVFKRKPAPDAIRGGGRFASRKRVKSRI
jgi:hypothetical protein